MRQAKRIFSHHCSQLIIGGILSPITNLKHSSKYDIPTEISKQKPRGKQVRALPPVTTLMSLYPLFVTMYF